MGQPRFACEIKGCTFKTDDYYDFADHDCQKPKKKQEAKKPDEKA